MSVTTLGKEGALYKNCAGVEARQPQAPLLPGAVSRSSSHFTDAELRLSAGRLAAGMDLTVSSACLPAPDPCWSGSPVPCEPLAGKATTAEPTILQWPLHRYGWVEEAAAAVAPFARYQRAQPAQMQPLPSLAQRFGGGLSALARPRGPKRWSEGASWRRGPGAALLRQSLRPLLRGGGAASAAAAYKEPYAAAAPRISRTAKRKDQSSAKGPGIPSVAKMIPALLLPLLGLFSSWEGGHCLVPEKLEQMSITGSRYIDREVENAVSGVRQMKVLMEKASKDHRDVLHALEDTKRKKEEALLRAQETEQQLTQKTEVCNETMLALWEECKPCLKQTCMRFYTRTCHSGAGLVGRQLEEFLNRSSPFSIWVNGERIDSLMDVDEQQGQRLDDLEERYAVVEEGVEDLFQKSTQAYGRLSPLFQSPFSGLRDAFWAPVRSLPRPFPGSRIARNVPAFSFFPSHYRPHQDFHQLFQPLFEMTQRLFEGAQRAMEPDGGQWLEGTRRPFLVSPYPSDDRMVCREIRRNSAGCLRMRDKCEKCQAILDVDCSQTDPDQTLLRDHFKDHLLLAEQLTRQYDDLLRSFQEEMLNTTSLLDQLSKQFGWVSQVANQTQNSSKSLRVIMVQTNSSTADDPSEAPATQVNLQLFDSTPLSLTVRGNMDDPGFMETVVNQALRQYKENEVE